MASFHELKASVSPRPGEPGASSAPNQGGYFGWEVTRRMQQPPAKIPTVSSTDVTPYRISSAMIGEKAVFPGMPVMKPKDAKPVTTAEAEYRRIKQAREERKRTAKKARNRGNRQR